VSRPPRDFAAQINDEGQTGTIRDKGGRIGSARGGFPTVPRGPDRVLDLRDAHQVLRRELRAKQRHPRHPERFRELIDAPRIADPRLALDEHRAGRRHVKQELA
jgi:hypothetical protein